jgi:glycosyltransferase involved in cell wall biosynthesis/2-polyprenyl-3-methyl-5-hydroxy-6-metoxy-1,4-benzoquinol methylase
MTNYTLLFYLLPGSDPWQKVLIMGKHDGTVRSDDSLSAVFGPSYFRTHCGPIPYDRADPHWGIFFGGIAETLVRSFHPTRVFDAGCAMGFLVEAFWDRGVEAWGRDISEFAISQVRADLRSFCEVGSIADPIGGEFDLITCIEVLEHMPEAAALQAIKALTAATDRILFSSSPSDLEEPTHINVKPTIYWLRLFGAQGFAPLLSYDPSFVTPYCMVLERVAQPPGEEILLGYSEIVRLRLLRAERDQSIRDLAARGGAVEQELQAVQQELGTLRGQHAQDRATLREAHAQELATLREAHAKDFARLHNEIENVRAQAELSRSESDRYRSEVWLAKRDSETLLASTSWRITGPIRAVISSAPPPLRLAVRRLAKFAYWTITPWRTAERVRFLLARNKKLEPPSATELTLPSVVTEAARPTELSLSSQVTEAARPTELSLSPQVTEAARPVVDPYARWIREHDTLDDADRVSIRAHIAELVRHPLISIAVPIYNTEEQHLREMIGSVIRQIYPHWELCLANDASTEPHVERVLQEFVTLDPRIKVVNREINGNICSASNSALDLATGEFVALLEHDDLLAPTALYEVAVEVNANPDADIIYSDSDLIDESGVRSGPYFKTDWDPDLALGQNMVSHLGVYRRSLIEKIGRLRCGFEGSQDYDLILRAADASAPDRIRHIPAVLYHWRRNAAPSTFSETSLERCVIAARRAIREHLARNGTQARIDVPPKTPFWTRVVYSLPAERPLVSIIVPARDRADLTARCVDGVLTRTDYEPVELLIVDNDSEEPETNELLTRLAKDPRVRIIRYSGDFNYAAMNNRAVQEARGQVIVLMNNDVDVISSLWLEEMVSHALRPEIGAVGAKLLYPDGLVQHAGVVLGFGHGAGHYFHLARREDVGHWGLLSLTRRVSAVTAACMAVRRSVYLEVGGLDEVNFTVAYNDVDLCLRMGEHGYAIVWTPFAELYHLGSATRGADSDGERLRRLEGDAEQLRRRWGRVLSCDPFYNVNCSVAANFELGFPSRRRKPWLDYKTRTNVPRAATNRSEVLLAPIDRSARIFEIGPSYSPIAPKADGWKTSTLDHATRSELIEKYRGHPGVDVNRIEEVDFVWKTGSITDAVPAHLHGTYDAFIASHVIEHTTDLIGFLDSAATLLAPCGVMILAVPDKRFCFDYFRPLSTTGQAMEAHAVHRSRHTRRSRFEHVTYVVKNGENGAWGQAAIQDLRFYHSLEDARGLFSTPDEDPAAPYVDAHAWQFTPASFELLMLELAWLGETDWRIDNITPATGCEFYVWLRRGGKVAAATLTETKLNTQRLMLLKRTLLETRDQIDFAFGRDGVENHSIDPRVVRPCEGH